MLGSSYKWAKETVGGLLENLRANELVRGDFRFHVFILFEGESVSKSSTAGLGSADSEGAKGVGGAEVSTDSGSTSSVKVVEVNKSQPSTSGRRVGAIEAGASIVDPKEGVLTVLNWPLESLSNPDGEVVFFTDAFKHGLRLPLRHSMQKILAQIGYALGQFNLNFWITLLGMITAFGIAEGEEPSYEKFAHLYSMTRAKSADQGVGAVKLPFGRSARALRCLAAELSEDLMSASGAGFLSLGIGAGGGCGEAHPHGLSNSRVLEMADHNKEGSGSNRACSVENC
ncbi:unnamed protein product [Prunus armeniaca]